MTMEPIDPNETQWERMLRVAGSGIGRVTEFIPAVGLWNNVVQPNVDRLNAPVNPQPRRQTAVSGDPFGLAARQGSGPSMAPQGSASAQGAAFLTSAFPGVRVTGLDRTRDRNRQVGGAPNSYHLRGNAIDFVPEPGKTIEDYTNAYRAAGWTVHEAIDETRKTNGTGPHFHIAVSPPTGAAAARAAGAGMFVAPSAAQLQSFIGNPVLQSLLDLPDAPQQARPADMPMYVAPDKDTLLADLREASKIEERDTSGDAWDRFAALLQGAAGGAANANPAAGLGQLILLAGGGAAQGFRGEKKEQEALDREQAAMQRQLNIALAQAGIDVDMLGNQIGNQNLDRGWTSGENQRRVDFENKQSVFDTLVAEAMANSNIQGNNAGTQNQFSLARANAGIQGLQGQAAAQNQGTATALELQQANASNPVKQQAQAVATTILSAGVPETPDTIAAATAINARNTAGLFAPFANSTVSSGGLSALPEDVAAAATEASQRAGGKEAGAMAAAAVVQQFFSTMAATPEGQAQLQTFVNERAQAGDPVARMIQLSRGQ